ncbi:hypothetical protein [Pseudoalteromonas pernae]|uniref:hypothetical protein n=1 Tax=Pseudoalteromonas pernae TaxID=3118054 RepID=UPI003242CBA3
MDIQGDKRNWYMRSFLVLCCLLGSFVTIANDFEQFATDCLNEQKKGNMTYVYNQCDVTVSIYYCDTEPAIWGKRCGDSEDFYYTHVAAVEPGKNKSFFKRPNLQYAACYGNTSSLSYKVMSSRADKKGKLLCLGMADSKLRQLDCGGKAVNYYIERVTPGTVHFQIPNVGKLTLKAGKRTVDGDKHRYYDMNELVSYACSGSKVSNSNSILNELNQEIIKRSRQACQLADKCNYKYGNAGSGVRG